MQHNWIVNKIFSSVVHTFNTSERPISLINVVPLILNHIIHV